MSGEEPQDSLMAFAEALRSRGGVENRPAVLGDERKELFRGKDLLRWVKAHPDKAAAAAPAGKGLEGEPLGQWLGAQLVRRRLAVRVDRASYKPLPGSKKLVKFPKRIVPLPPAEAGVFDEEGFYVWLYQRPTSKWTYVLAALVPVAVLAACCFPLAPDWVKVGVFYVSSALLVLILGVLALRGVLALATWLLFGRTLWLLPNCLSEEVPITQLLKPLVSFERPAEGSSKWANHPLTRLAVAGALGGLLFALHRHSPDKAKVAKGAAAARDEVLDWLGVRREGYKKLAGNATAAANATNGSAADASAGAEAGLGAEAAAEAADAAAAGGDGEL